MRPFEGNDTASCGGYVFVLMKQGWVSQVQDDFAGMSTENYVGLAERMKNRNGTESQ